jgi:hypothetical protein
MVRGLMQRRGRGGCHLRKLLHVVCHYMIRMRYEGAGRGGEGACLLHMVLSIVSP